MKNNNKHKLRNEDYWSIIYIYIFKKKSVTRPFQALNESFIFFIRQHAGHSRSTRWLCFPTYNNCGPVQFPLSILRRWFGFYTQEAHGSERLQSSNVASVFLSERPWCSYKEKNYKWTINYRRMFQTGDLLKKSTPVLKASASSSSDLSHLYFMLSFPEQLSAPSPWKRVLKSLHIVSLKEKFNILGNIPIHSHAGS